MIKKKKTKKKLKQYDACPQLGDYQAQDGADTRMPEQGHASKHDQ